MEAARPLAAEAEIHERLCRLACDLKTGSQIVFPYVTPDAPPADPLTLSIDPADLPHYLGVRGFELIRDVPGDDPCRRIATARRLPDHKSFCPLR